MNRKTVKRNCPICGKSFKTIVKIQVFCTKACITHYQRLLSTYSRSQIIRELLLPGNTLESVGEIYGITRERVRQIIETRIDDFQDIKRKLRYESENFRCRTCGNPLPILSRRFCSPSCLGLWKRFDFEHEVVCINCRRTYYRHRNWIFTGRSGKYCSIKCRFEDSRTLSPHMFDKFMRIFR